MKKKIAIVFSSLIAILGTINVFGASGLIIENKTYVPVRGVFEELGFKVSYDKINATAIIKDNDYTIKIPKDTTYFIVNNKSIKPDSPQKIVNGSMYLPLRAIADSIGANTSWNAANKMAHISYNGKDSYVVASNISNKNNKSNKNSKNSIIVYKSTNEYGVKFYSLNQNKEKQIIDYVEQSIKDGYGGVSIIGESLKYPHTAEFSDSKLNSVTSDGSYNEYVSGCEYSAHVGGYVTAQLPNGMRKETSYYATVCFNVSNNEITDLTLYCVLISK